MDDQRIVSSIQTRHLDALRDQQKNENDRLQKIKNDPSRQLSRHHSADPEIGINENEEEDSLPVKEVWADALKASKLTVQARVAVTKRNILSLYQPVDTGYVKSKIGHWEKLIVLVESTIEQVIIDGILHEHCVPIISIAIIFDMIEKYYGLFVVTLCSYTLLLHNCVLCYRWILQSKLDVKG